MLPFQPVTLGIKPLADSYTLKWGEGSCQHSFVSSWCLRHKYGDMFCEKDGFLYTLRSLKCSDKERVYLFPHGDRADIKRAIGAVLDDAHSHGARVRFETLTRYAKDLVLANFPMVFEAEERRDYAEYVYLTQRIAEYSGPDMAYKRRDFQRFGRDFAGRAEARRITPADIDGVRDFQREWLSAKLEETNDPAAAFQVRDEDVGIQCALDNFAELGLVGIIILIDGKIHGYAYGAKISDDCIDEINENCTRGIPNIYPFAKHEFARLCCEGIKYINFEEDVGSLTLRAAKNHYKPAFLIDKYIVREHE